MMRNLFAALLLALSALGTAPAAKADDCKSMGSTPINKSYEIDRKKIEKCMLEGKDPPKEWLTRGGVSSDVGGSEFGNGAYVPVGLKSSNAAVPFYEGTGCGYVKGGTKPGGKSDGGSRDGACNGGGGGSAGGTGGNGDSGLPPTDPSSMGNITNAMINCQTSLAGALDIEKLMNTITNAVQGGSGNTKSCVSGKMSLCGMSTGGAAKCPGSDDNAPASFTTNQAVTLGKLGDALSGMAGIMGPVTTQGAVTATLPNGMTIQVPNNTTIAISASNVASATNAIFQSNKKTLTLPNGGKIVLTPGEGGAIQIPAEVLSDSNPQFNSKGNGSESALDAVNPCLRLDAC